MITSAAGQRYWLGDSPPEVDHLLAQAEFLAPDAAELLDRIGVAPGASVIDIGCGVLGVLPQLRSRVGDSGRVAGPDIEPRLLAVAGQLSAQHGLISRRDRPALSELPAMCSGQVTHELSSCPPAPAGRR
jgi:SAM-dependent methyltransferase